MSLSRSAEHWVPAGEMADRLGVTPRRMGQLAEERLEDGTPFPAKGAGRARRFAWSAGFDWYIRFKQDEAVRRARGPEEAPTMADAELRKEVANAQLRETQVRKIRAELVEVATYRQEFQRVCGRIRASLMAAPGVYGPKSVGLATPAEAVAVWRRAIAAVLEELQGAGAEDEDDGEAVPS